MKNETMISTLKARKAEIQQELDKIDGLLGLYTSDDSGAQAILPLNGRKFSSKKAKRNGNSTLIIETAKSLIQQKGAAVLTEDIEKTLLDKGFSADYSRGLRGQIAGYLSRKKEFVSTARGWRLK